jgi:hypothetical protein
LVGRDLAKQFGQYRRITNVAASGLNGSNLKRFFVDPEMDLAPDMPPT